MGEAIPAMLGQVGVNQNIPLTECGALAERSWFTNDAQHIARLTLTCDADSPKGYNSGRSCNPNYDSILNPFYGRLDNGQQANTLYQAPGEPVTTLLEEASRTA